MSRIYVGNHTVSHMERFMSDIPYLFTGFGINHTNTPTVIVPRFETQEDFHSGTVGIDIRKIYFIGVPQTNRP